MNTEKINYADTTTDGEYFCQGPHSGFYVSEKLDDMVKAAESGEITGPEGGSITAIYLAVCDDTSRKVWSA